MNVERLRALVLELRADAASLRYKHDRGNPDRKRRTEMGEVEYDLGVATGYDSAAEMLEEALSP